MAFYKSHRYSPSVGCLRIVLAINVLLAPCAGYSQAAGTSQHKETKPNVQSEVAKLNSGEVSPYGLHLIGNANAKQAIPALEKQFPLAEYALDKAQIAQVLVKLKDPTETYWNYLVNLITPVLDSTAPSPLATNAQGKEVQGVSPAFEAWVDNNKLNPPTELENATYIYPAYILLLGQTDDQRAIPLLRRALSSPNHLLAISAAQGLAELQDEDGVPLIIDAAKRAPASAANLIAEPLGYFKSTEAQAALDQYVSKDRVQRVRERAKLGSKPLQQ